ncbi:MAG: ThiF family adenylyltransferase [Oligoflexus sp.]|nr:ThiF family adenylyltransferase [Oligoflexus sp.]
MRYARQTVLADLGQEGQAAFAEAKVLIVGVGGLGSPLALYLAAAGVGCLGLVDADRVSLSNLQRQILFQTPDIGQTKVTIAKNNLEALNPDVRCVLHPVFLDNQNAEDIAKDYEIIVDASDNFETKYLLNDLCVKLNRPLVYGSILRFKGQASVFWAERGPCYRCLFPRLPREAIPNCAEAGVLGALAGVIGSIQALEVMKLILLMKDRLPVHHETLLGRLLSFDAATMTQTINRLPKDPDCPVCSRAREDIVLPELDLSCALETEAVPNLARDWQNYRWIDVREQGEWDQGRVPNALHWPLSKLNQGLIPEKISGPTVIYCQSGVRSRQALKRLKAEDFVAVLHYPEGFGGWVGPVERGK